MTRLTSSYSFTALGPGLGGRSSLCGISDVSSGKYSRLPAARPVRFGAQVLDLPEGAGTYEEADGTSPASVRLTTLSDAGDVTGGVTVVPLDAGAPRGLGLSCREGQCRVAVTLEVEGRGELHGFEWKPGSQRKLLKLIGLGGPAAAAVAPIIRDDAVYVADLRDGQGLVRRLGVEW
jgi:hypothetical protein